MKRLSVLLAALLLPACAPSTEWGPNFMHWSNPDSKMAQIEKNTSATATQGAIESDVVGEADEGTLLEPEFMNQPQMQESQPDSDGGGE
jgi:hypothetical protein